MVRPRVFFDIAVDVFELSAESVHRVIFELFSDTAPKTCENFRALCTGEKGLSALSERPLYYKNSIIHRSIKDFMIQGGGAHSRRADFTKRNGSGGESIYGRPFPDEDLTRPVDSEGLLCMANKGPNTNGSQFFVTLRACSHLNGRHVVFGRVLRGYREVIQKLAETPVDEKDRPTLPITIANCGELMMRNKVQDAQAQAEGKFVT
ncbi:cyclophilin-like domain-containing protein [Irpex rosettiformis]|uniref:Cyclophilin-like domain-containing protein n=1 Tax=Irpex rosettiformis TaxID=378272 RepID=A0ACB8TPX9_9APHY|nr:cyclophilin-like domain-containing protein [Irpex rosettiformis]